MPMKLGGYLKRYSDDNWLRRPRKHGSNRRPELAWTGRWAERRAGSLGADDGNRFSKVLSESIYYSQPFSEVP